MNNASRNRFEPAAPASPMPELERLIRPGIIGHYTHFEVTEIFAIRDGCEGAVNVFTILVADERDDAESAGPKYLNGKPIRLPKFQGWTFGLRRYTAPVADLMQPLASLDSGAGWECSGEHLEVGKLTPMPSQFAPSDNATSIPLNCLLKNNFWNGSHLFEWADRDKLALKPLFNVPERLQELSAEIQKYVPIRLATVTDRLGNFIVQLPITVLIAKFHKLQACGFAVECAWHPKATARPLLAICDLEYDGVVSGFSSAPVNGPTTLLPMRAGRGLHRGFLWDEQNSVALAATGGASFIETFRINMQVPDPEPRTFIIKKPDGSGDQRRVGLIRHSVQSLVGNPQPDDNGGWTANRMYADEARRLEAERLFVQYRPESGQTDASHRKALDDLRRLISRYGQKGVWLWDPYLGAQDVMETLFYCPYTGVDLRGLTTPAAGLIDDQREQLENAQGNLRGLSLEYRVRRGQAGWDFHDRFLIFPGGDPNGVGGALAWSLGTSVNGIGKAHHILQRADNGQMIMNAFVKLWNLLDQPEHLIWKRP